MEHREGTGSPRPEFAAPSNPTTAGDDGHAMKENGKMEYPGIDPNLLLAKMSNGEEDDKTLWLFLLLLLFGKDGFGSGAAAGVRDTASLQDLNAAQTALTQAIANSVAAMTERTNDITRDQAANALRNETGQARISELVQNCCFSLQNGQCSVKEAVAAVGTQMGFGLKDVEKAICDCCCKLGIGQAELQNALERGLCETQNMIQMGFAQTNNAICSQTAEIKQAIHTDGEATRALITQNRMDDLQAALQVERDRNSNLRQTAEIAEIVRQQCHPHHWWGNGGGPPGPPFRGGGPANGG